MGDDLDLDFGPLDREETADMFLDPPPPEESAPVIKSGNLVNCYVCGYPFGKQNPICIRRKDYVLANHPYCHMVYLKPD
jgi:hypothetical protein